MNLNRLAEWDGTKWIESDPNEPIVGILRIRTVSGKWVKLDLTEKRRKEKYCFDEHPKFQMVFCRLKPEHEGNHRSRSGIEWEPIVSVEKARAERKGEI